MRTVGEEVRQLSFFDVLDERWIDVVVGCAVNTHVSAGTDLFREGEPANSFYVIRHGRVAIETRTPTASIVVDSVDDGEVVGWSWLVPPHRWTFDARATEETSLIAFDGACLRGKCDGNPELGYALLQRVVQTMSARLQSARVRLLDLYGARA